MQPQLRFPLLTFSLVIFTSLISVGCDTSDSDSVVRAKRPRPVSTKVLRKQSPPSSALVAASVASWKTQEIGFEVSGRVEWVSEINAMIEGRLKTADGAILVDGSPVARIDPERYELSYEIAKADLQRAEQQVIATQIRIEKTIPAQLRAAEADRQVAAIEVDRNRRLVLTNAVSQSELDSYEAELATAVSQVEQLNAELRSVEADLVADKLGVEQAKQSLRDAERDLENCVLYSSFRGQIADTAVVPGSVVSSGAPVATIQMMDPIKIEFEVSANDSRLIGRKQDLPIVITRADGSSETRRALIYQIDPVADPATRTFTVTLLVLNEPVTDHTNLESPSTPVIERAWRTDLNFLPIEAPSANYVVVDSIEQDQQGYYVWRIDNFRQGEPIPDNRRFKVSKMRVRPIGPIIPFLSEFFFQPIELLDETYVPDRDLVTGPLTFPYGSRENWDQETVFVDRSGRWLLRPGDLVMVDLSGSNAEQGIYVPMDAVSYSENKTFLFILESKNDTHKARRIEVNLIDPSDAKNANSYRRVQSVDGQTLEGLSYIVEGVHYLVDGEQVRPITMEATP